MPPLQTTTSTGAARRTRGTSAGTTFLMEASDDPRMSQLSMTSQSAMPWRSSSERLAATSSSAGTGSPAHAAITRQKRLRGLP